MSVIKQISVFNGSSWDTDNVGANAGNIDLMSADGTTASTIAGSTNLLTGLNNILPASQLTASRALIADANGKISSSNISTTILNTALSGASTSTSLQSQINTINTTLNNFLPSSTLTASRALVSNSSKKISTSSVTSTQLGYVSGVTSSIQTQLDSKINITPEALTVVTGSNNYTFIRCFTYRIGKLVNVSVEMATNAAKTAGTPIFALRVPNVGPVIPALSSDSSSSRMQAMTLLGSGAQATYTHWMQSGENWYVTNQGMSFTANSTYHIVGSFICT